MARRNTPQFHAAAWGSLLGDIISFTFMMTFGMVGFALKIMFCPFMGGKKRRRRR